MPTRLMEIASYRRYIIRLKVLRAICLGVALLLVILPIGVLFVIFLQPSTPTQPATTHESSWWSGANIAFLLFILFAALLLAFVFISQWLDRCLQPTNQKGMLGVIQISRGRITSITEWPSGGDEYKLALPSLEILSPTINNRLEYVVVNHERQIVFYCGYTEL